MTEPDQAAPQPASPSANQRGRALRIAAVIGVLIGALVVGAVLLRGGDSETSAADPGNRGPLSTADLSGDCDQPAGSQTPPTTAPASSWESVGQIAAPTAPETTGPGVVDGSGLRRCFSHDPAGALYAAANWMASFTDLELAAAASADDSITAPGPGLEAFRTQLADVTQEDLTGGFQIVGFRFRTYTADDALLNLAIGIPGRGMVTFPMPMHQMHDRTT